MRALELRRRRLLMYLGIPSPQPSGESSPQQPQPQLSKLQLKPTHLSYPTLAPQPSYKKTKNRNIIKASFNAPHHTHTMNPVLRSQNPPRHQSPAPVHHVQLDPSIRHPVFFTDKLWKAVGTQAERLGSPVAQGYVYRDFSVPVPVPSPAEHGSKL